MNTTEQIKALRKEQREVGDRIRCGKSKDLFADNARYEELDRLMDALQPEEPVVCKNWWDLPIAAKMWAADGRDIERE
jgi:hypothetical protein